MQCVRDSKKTELVILCIIYSMYIGMYVNDITFIDIMLLMLYLRNKHNHEQ